MSKMSKIILAGLYHNSANRQVINGLFVCIVLCVSVVSAFAPQPVLAAGPVCSATAPADGIDLCCIATQLKGSFGILLFVGVILVVATMLIPVEGFLQNFGLNIGKDYLMKAVAAAVLLGLAASLAGILGFEGACGSGEG